MDITTHYQIYQILFMSLISGFFGIVKIGGRINFHLEIPEGSEEIRILLQEI